MPTYLNLKLKDFTQPANAGLLYRHLKNNYPGAKYKAAYEADFCGFGIRRELTSLGIECVLFNAAGIPKGDKELQAKRTISGVPGKAAKFCAFPVW